MMGRPAVADYPPGAHLPPRVIDDFEIIWMLRGRGWFSAGEQVPLAPGLLLVVPPGLRHSFRWDPARPSRHGYVNFDPHGLPNAPPPQVRVLRMTPADPLAGLCGYLLWLGSCGAPGWQRRVRETLEFLLQLACSGPMPDSEPPPALAPALRPVVAYLRRQWSVLPLRRVGVEELAAATLVSRGYLNRMFQGSFDLSVSAALEQVRCARAETLLARTNLPVESIARQCGFADLAHFSHRFASLHGVAPTAYRTAPDGAPSVLEHPGVRRLDRLLWE
jgi:AraC family transcriptional regulator